MPTINSILTPNSILSLTDEADEGLEILYEQVAKELNMPEISYENIEHCKAVENGSVVVVLITWQKSQQGVVIVLDAKTGTIKQSYDGASATDIEIEDDNLVITYTIHNFVSNPKIFHSKIPLS